MKKESTKFATEVKIETAVGTKLPCTLQARNLKRRAKKEGLKKIKKRWEGKPLHGQYPKRSKQASRCRSRESTPVATWNGSKG